MTKEIVIAEGKIQYLCNEPEDDIIQIGGEDIHYLLSDYDGKKVKLILQIEGEDNENKNI